MIDVVALYTVVQKMDERFTLLSVLYHQAHHRIDHPLQKFTLTFHLVLSSISATLT